MLVCKTPSRLFNALLHHFGLKTYASLALKLNFQPATISAIINHHNSITAGNILAIYDACGGSNGKWEIERIRDYGGIEENPDYRCNLGVKKGKEVK